MKITDHNSGKSRFDEHQPSEPQDVSLQHINVKLLLKDQKAVDLDPVIPVFHSWIQQQSGDELLLDVADYRHVYGGPGIILIGHEADYSIDNTDNRWGVRYNRKTSVEGDNQEKLADAVRTALQACQRLQEDTRLKGKLHFNGTDIEIYVNDRLLAPNHEATRAALNPEFEAFSDLLFGGAKYSVSANADPRRLLTVTLKSSRAFTVGELLENMRTAPANRLLKHVPRDADPDYDWGNDSGNGFAAAAPGRGEFVS